MAACCGLTEKLVEEQRKFDAVLALEVCYHFSKGRSCSSNGMNSDSTSYLLLVFSEWLISYHLLFHHAWLSWGSLLDCYIQFYVSISFTFLCYLDSGCRMFIWLFKFYPGNRTCGRSCWFLPILVSSYWIWWSYCHLDNKSIHESICNSHCHGRICLTLGMLLSILLEVV